MPPPPPPAKSLALQELETLEKFLEETPQNVVIAEMDYTLERVKVNVEKVQNTNEEYLIPRCIALLKKLENILNSVFSRQIIYIEDKKFVGAGLCDKFRYICWLYSFSKLLNCDFKIYLKTPFNLSDYLTENKCNWLINKEDIINDEAKKIVVVSCDYKHFDVEFENMEKIVVPSNDFVRTIDGLVNDYQQILCYFKMKRAGYVHFREAFFELFCPSQKLQNNIDENLKKLGTEFVAAHFRFQKLLGDFTDSAGPGCKNLDNGQKEVLIERCINVLQKITEHNDGLKVLVCSDSAIFLKAVKNLDFVFVVGGDEDRIKHIAYDQDVDDKSVLKLFTDLFLMSYAKKIYKVIEGDMYCGQFAITASMLGQKQYCTVKNGVFCWK